jgi:hypothetical protein
MNGLEQERLACNGIDICGLNPSDRERIEQIGFDRWLDEICDAPPLKPEKISDARLCRSGPKCLKAVRRRAAPVTGRSQFCIGMRSQFQCSTSAEGAQMRADRQEVASETRMDIGRKGTCLYPERFYVPQVILRPPGLKTARNAERKRKDKMTKAMKLIDANSGLMECRFCGSRHVASLQSGSDRADGVTRYYRGSWQCGNERCPSKRNKTNKPRSSPMKFSTVGPDHSNAPGDDRPRWWIRRNDYN